ncbi:MAG: Gfo/Idh/MocA family oxidoreductase [Microbacterium sp.]
MRTGRVGVGVIGAGVISSRYLTNLSSFPDVRVLFVADIDVERAASQAQEFAVPRSGTVSELLADPEVEIVVNLTIPAVHAEVAMAAVAAGKHVWSEKPFALDRESGRELLEKAEQAGLRVATAPDSFLGSGVQTARRLIEAGEIGEALTALSVMQTPGPDGWHPNPEFLFQEGAGPLFDIGPYHLTALVQLFGPVASVFATASQARTVRTIGAGPRAGEEFDVTTPTHISAIYEFESGRSAQCLFSFDSKLPRTLFEISGSEATLSVPDPNTYAGELHIHRGRDDVAAIPSSGVTTNHGIGVAELAQAIREGRPERASGEQAYHVLDVMLATLESARSSARVDVESTTVVAPALPVDWDPHQPSLFVEE